MRFVKRFTLILFLLFPLTVDANLPFIVKTVYFQPKDEEPLPDTIKPLMVEVQDFYRDNLAKHGYGLKTFRLDTTVHVIHGQHPLPHYQPDTFTTVFSELPQHLKNQNNIHVILVAGLPLVDNRAWGTGYPIYGNACGGNVVIALECGHFDVQLIAHELGHAFGLYHNLVGNPSVMGHGVDGHDDTLSLNAFEARWLDKHHYFNNHHAINHVPEFVDIDRVIETQDDILRFRFTVTSINGLHQTHIFRSTDVGVLGWQRIDGHESTVSFLLRRNKIENHKTITFQVLDVMGNHNMFRVNITHLPNNIHTKNPTLILPKPMKDKPTPDLELDISLFHKQITLWANVRKQY